MIKGLVVAFENPMHEEDAQRLAGLLRMLRNVVSVTPSVDETDDRINREMVRLELRDKIDKVFKPDGGWRK
jgi:hypothetical protein